MLSQTVQAILLGILQGLTEFLPISSSAHLLLLPWFLGWEPMGLTFDVLVHAGTLLAVVVYFSSYLKHLAKQIIRYVVKHEPCDPADLKVLGAIVAGTLPALFVGGFFHDLIERELRTPIVTTLTLSSFGVLLWWAGKFGRGSRCWAELRPLDGFLIGAAQALALIPGVSRSGITITAALVLRFSRVDSARFSFLLAVPVIFLTTAAKAFQLIQEGAGAGPEPVVLLTGVLCSFLSGFLCIKYFLQYLAGHSFLLFACYRLLLAFLVYLLLVRSG